MLYTDIPTEADFTSLDAVRDSVCISIYLPTTPVTRNNLIDRITFKNAIAEAVAQLEAANLNTRSIAAAYRLLNELLQDECFWTYQADGLAVFATPHELRTFRLPTCVEHIVEVADRFHLKPLLPLLAYPGACFILALSQKAVRIIEVTSSLAETVAIEALPKSMSDALKRQFPKDRAPARRVQGREGMKVLIGQYCRMIDRALRPMLAGRTQPLIVAAVEEMAAIYRANNSYPHVLSETIIGNPDRISDQELALFARELATKHAKRIISDRLRLIFERASSDMTSTDVTKIAKAAVCGRVGTLLIDTATARPGTINPKDGTITLAEQSSADTYDILDELAGLTIRTGGDVLPVSRAMLPADSPVAAIFRFRSSAHPE
ncbi:MAG: hypothetical protein K2Q28_10655 [Hyphomicrobium sp.]|nr:hypothetical protein [Hyphomicrobium sp.]